jgi:hypothetical protein
METSACREENRDSELDQSRKVAFISREVRIRSESTQNKRTENSVTRLGEFSPLGYYLLWEFFERKNDKGSPKISATYIFIKSYLYPLYTRLFSISRPITPQSEMVPLRRPRCWGKNFVLLFSQKKVVFYVRLHFGRLFLKKNRVALTEK